MVSIKRVVSVNIGGYDSVIGNHYPNPDWKYFMFTDGDADGWEVVKVDLQDNVKKQSRTYKWLVHKFIECDYSLYIDANIRILCDIDTLIDKYLNGYDIAMYKHRLGTQRDCIYQEAETCVSLKLEDPKLINNQVLKYWQEEYPKHNGLHEGTIILRRHTDKINELGQFVWDEIEHGPYRDQLIFDYAAWKLGVKVNTIEGMIKLYPEAKKNLECMIGKIDYVNPYFEMDEHTRRDRSV